MEKRILDLPRGFDLQTQRVVGQYVAALDDQLRLLRQEVGTAGVRELEWQPRGGVNTVGMLLAHLAVAECWWFCVVAMDRALESDPYAHVSEILGMRMEDDGLPLAPDGLHPQSLSGREWPDYDRVLGLARRATHDVVASWLDEDLTRTHRTTKRELSRDWILYHVLEHCSGHFGQIKLLRHLMRAEGLWQEAS